MSKVTLISILILKAIESTQKGFLLSPIYKHLKGIFVGFFLKKHFFKERTTKFIALLTKEKQLIMNEEMMTLTFFELYAGHIKS